MSSDYDPPDVPLDVIHADHEMVVLCKPDGLLSVPGKGGHLADCLYERVLGAFPTALVVHRLDRDTSGVMVFALTPHAQRFLSKQFEERRARKTYIALVDGVLEPREGEVDLPLIVDWPHRPLQMVCHETGKPALTEYRVLRVKDGISRVRLRPRTGRTHQLRVHMQALGHVILGDPLYAQGAARAYPRLMLHSEELRIAHPESGRGMVFRAKAPF